jgi:ABC-2 type transport system permease protein
VTPVVLATGIGRGDLVVSKLMALGLQLVALGALTWLALAVGLVAAGGGISLSSLTAATVQLTLLGALFGALALAAGAAIGNRAVAAGVAVGVALATYPVDALAGLVGWLEPFRVLSPFHWYAPGNPLVVGWSPGWSALLVVVTVVLGVGAVIAFDRRDVGV